VVRTVAKAADAVLQARGVGLGGLSGRSLVLRLVGGVYEVEEGADFDVLLCWVAHVPVLVDAVAVAATGALALDVSRLDEVGDDALCGSLGDPNLFGHVSKPDVWHAGDAEEHLRVVGEEAPGMPVRT
jgi:hypothetical protein